MPVDFQQIMARIHEIGAGSLQRQEILKDRRKKAQGCLFQYAADLEYLRYKVRSAQEFESTIRCALPVEQPLTHASPPPASIRDATLIAADGSQIIPDRHAAVQFCVINVGAVVMKLNSGQTTDIHQESQLYYGDELQAEKLTSEGAISLRRDLSERIFVESLTRGMDDFILNLTDGTIEIWGAKDIEDPRAYQRSVEEYITILAELRQRGIPTAGYVDKPAADLVVRLLELALASPQDLEHIRDYRPLRGVTDLWLFGYRNHDFQLLKPGERSAVFQLQSGSEKFYKDSLAIHFFYLNVSDSEQHAQIARVEIPRWVAEDPEMLDSLHAVLIQQCRIMGSRPYPYLLHRAHETAVVRHDEKDQIEALLQQELARQGQPLDAGSNKQGNKDLAGRRRR
jgi:hypothetical protein